MSIERENLNQSLKVVDYDIAGNPLRAYQDVDGRLVFVLDLLIDDIKPNVLLVIDSADNRKWDDIISNDWGIDLETVRPKKDNKYQKLDIEYVGLDKYSNLIRVYLADGDVTSALAELQEFRIGVARHVATERLAVAERLVGQARETIEKTNDTIATLQEKLKGWRVKLQEYKSQIGRAPGKQVASKILRAESQIDAIGEKMVRTKKRLASAKNRLVNAEDDADIARNILTRIQQIAGHDGQDAIVTDLTTINKTGAEKMADNDIKPILDQDPNILDEDIAFKPIVFDTPVAPVVPSAPSVTSNVPEFKPFGNDVEKTEEVVFAPVVADVPVAPAVPETLVVPETLATPVVFDVPEVQEVQAPVIEPVSVPVAQEVHMPAPVVEQMPVPVLDSITAVGPVLDQADSEVFGGDVLSPELSTSVVPEVPMSPVLEAPTLSPVVSDVPVAPVVPAPAMPVVNAPAPSAPVAPMPEISASPVDGPGRPVSPIAAPVVAVSASSPRKPTTLYYVLLMVLIALSIFTLWIYQKSSNQNLPELGASVQAETQEEVVVQDGQDANSPFLGGTEDVKAEDVKAEKVSEPVQVVMPAPEVKPVETESVEIVMDIVPEEVPATPAEAVTISPSVEVVSVPATPAQEDEVIEPQPVEENPFLSDDTVVAPAQKSIAEIIASKPVYNVARDDKKFVADPEYETGEEDEETVEEVVEKEVPVVDVAEPVVTGVTDEVVTEVVQDTCADGNLPDENGCCSGEESVDLGGGELACCVVGTEECFPPMK